MKKLILLLVFLYAYCISSAQLQIPDPLRPGIRTMKTRQFSGSGGSGYWNLKYFDKEGRTVIQESYKRQVLLAKYAYQYNRFNDETLYLVLFDINHPTEVDTISQTSYTYDQKGQILRKETNTGLNTIMLERIKLENEGYLEYREISQSIREEGARPIVDTTFYQIFKSEGKIVRRMEYSADHQKIETIEFTYNERGDLKSRRITRVPTHPEPAVYIGGPGADDTRFQYKYNGKGRIKTAYVLIAGKRHKVAKYAYREW